MQRIICRDSSGTCCKTEFKGDAQRLSRLYVRATSGSFREELYRIQCWLRPRRKWLVFDPKGHFFGSSMTPALMMCI